MRITQWGLSVEGDSNVGGGDTTSVLDLDVDFRTTRGLASLPGFTVTRTIMDIYFRALAVPSLDSVQEVALGIALFPTNLPTINHPSPRSENWDWVWQKTILWVPWTVQIANEGVFRQLMQSIRIDTDIARRYRSEEQTYRLVINNIGGEDISVDERARILYRAP